MSDLYFLADRWLEGWAVSRGATLTRRTDVVDIDLGPDSRSRRRELVMVVPSVSVLQAALAEVAMTDDLWATVIGERPHVGHPGVPVQDEDEALMTVSLPQDAELPDGVSLEADGRRAFARINVDGEHAAGGQVGLADGYAVFDRIRTQDAFKRRGLGSRVMQALTAWSVDQGATTGVLVASAQGQLLYESLGWTRPAPLTTWARAPRTW